MGKQGGCLSYIIAIVATLTVRDPLLRSLEDTSEPMLDDDHHVSKEGIYLYILVVFLNTLI